MTAPDPRRQSRCDERSAARAALGVEAEKAADVIGVQRVEKFAFAPPRLTPLKRIRRVSAEAAAQPSGFICRLANCQAIPSFFHSLFCRLRATRSRIPCTNGLSSNCGCPLPRASGKASLRPRRRSRGVSCWYLPSASRRPRMRAWPGRYLWREETQQIGRKRGQNFGKTVLPSSPGTPAFGSEAQARRGEDRGGGNGAATASPPPIPPPAIPGEGELLSQSSGHARSDRQHPREVSRGRVVRHLLGSEEFELGGGKRPGGAVADCNHGPEVTLPRAEIHIPRP